MKIRNLRQRVEYNAARYNWTIQELQNGEFALMHQEGVVLDHGTLKHLDKNIKTALRMITGNPFICD
jgi:hypothetical protein